MRAFVTFVITVELKFTAESNQSSFFFTAMASACQELLHAEFPTLDPDLQNYVQGKEVCNM